EESRPPDSTVEAVTLEDLDASDRLTAWLAVIQDHEADPMATSYELLGQKYLLPLCSATMSEVLTSGQSRIGVRRDKTHGWGRTGVKLRHYRARLRVSHWPPRSHRGAWRPRLHIT